MFIFSRHCGILSPTTLLVRENGSSIFALSILLFLPPTRLASPVIEQWVPALEQGLYSFESAATSAGQEGNERLHWSGLHVTLKVINDVFYHR